MTAFTDNFTGTSGDTLESRTGWTRVGGAAGACKISASNSLGYPASVADTAYQAPTTGTGDHYAQADSLYAASLVAGCFPICIRVTDSSNFVGFRIRDSGAGVKRDLYKRVATAFTQLAADNNDPGNGTYKLVGNGSALEVFYNSASILTATDSFNSTVQTPGIVVRAAVTIATMIDNWQSDVNAVAARPVKMAGEWGGYAGVSGGFAG